MEKLRYYLKRYPNRIKYGLILLDILAMIIAIRVYVNYISIETTIANTITEREQKMDELSFAQNFLVQYERSDYAKYFLQHENNMLLRWEYIIKFEENTKKVLTWDQSQAQASTSKPTTTDANWITSPQDSWKKFLQEKTK